VQEKENIEQLFRDAFSNYEEPVRPELWSKISSAIHTTTPVDDPSSIANSTISSGSGIIGTAGMWIAGAAVVVLTSVGAYYLATQQSTELPVNEQVEVSSNATPELPVIEQQATTQRMVAPAENLTVHQTAPSNSNSERISHINNAPSSEANSLQPVKPIDYASTISDQKSNAQQVINQPSVQTSAPGTQNTENESAKPSTINEKEEAYSHFLVNPVSGVAPLTVDFIYSGEAHKTEWQFGDGQSNSQISATQHTFDKPGEYNVTLKVFDEAGHAMFLNKTIKVQANLQIKYIPNIFTPNNDGRNDIFTFDAPNVAEMEVLIYDQTGKVVYKWTGFDGGWDGKLNSGDVAPDGTYFYIIFATGENGEKNQQKGTISVKR